MKTFKKELSDLASYALEIKGLKNEYKDEDILNAVLVFMEVFSSLMYDYHKDKISQEQMEVIFQEAGNSLRQTVNVFTGIDMTKIFSKENNNE